MDLASLNTDVILTGNSDTSDLAGDLKQLCQVFEHIEKLLIFAASIHRKLIDAPRLAQSSFTDYFNYYLPKMGTSLESVCYEKVSAILIDICILLYSDSNDEVSIHRFQGRSRIAGASHIQSD